MAEEPQTNKPVAYVYIEKKPRGPPWMGVYAPEQGLYCIQNLEDALSDIEKAKQLGCEIRNEVPNIHDAGKYRPLNDEDWARLEVIKERERLLQAFPGLCEYEAKFIEAHKETTGLEGLLYVLDLSHGPQEFFDDTEGPPEINRFTYLLAVHVPGEEIFMPSRIYPRELAGVIKHFKAITVIKNASEKEIQEIEKVEDTFDLAEGIYTSDLGDPNPVDFYKANPPVRRPLNQAELEELAKQGISL